MRRDDPERIPNLIDAALHRAIRRFLCRMGASESDAEDATQNACVRILTMLETLRDETKFSAYFAKTALNEYRQIRRRTGVPREVAADDAVEPRDYTANAEDAIFVEEQRARVREAVRRLSPDQRDYLVRRYFLGQSNAEIARATGRNEAACRALHTRALRTLRQVFIPTQVRG